MTKEECEIETSKAIMEMRNRIAELEKELEQAKKVQVVEHFEAYGQCRDSRRIASLEAENAELKDKLKNLESVAEVRLANWQKYEQENAELKRGCNLTKSLLYCAKRTCDNCGFVNCENFQRQRKSEPCALYISYQDRIKNLTNESDVLRESFNNSEMNLSFVSEQLTKAKDLISNLLRVTYGEGWNYSLDVKVKAEDFLKENK